MKVAFLGFDQMHGRINIGSSRIRCDWLIKYWPEATRFKQGGKYDVVVFQKAYWVDYAKAFKGIKILDLCDPDWLDWQGRVVEMIQEVDAITTSSFELAKYITSMTDKPVWFIPDRMDLEYHKERKEHEGKAQGVTWFGYSHNFPALNSSIKSLLDLGLDLYVISNEPYHPPSYFHDKLDVTNIPWGLDTVNQDILKGDMVINPRLSSNNFKFKSNNKTLTAWALGMPVADDNYQLKKFMDEGERKAEARIKLNEIEEKWDVKISIQEYKNLIKELYANKKK